MTLQENRYEFQRIMTPEKRLQILEQCGYVCAKCGSSKNLQIDHITALSLGGENIDDNYQVLCKVCNCSKGGKRNDKYYPRGLPVKRDVMLPKRFNSDDVKVWQAAANEETGGNLTLWMELTLNKAAKKYKKWEKKKPS